MFPQQSSNYTSFGSPTLQHGNANVDNVGGSRRQMCADQRQGRVSSRSCSAVKSEPWSWRLQCGAPNVISWYMTPHLTMVITTINHSDIVVMFTNLANYGAPPCKPSVG